VTTSQSTKFALVFVIKNKQRQVQRQIQGFFAPLRMTTSLFIAECDRLVVAAQDDGLVVAARDIGCYRSA
jgi:hypothetical protein